MPSTTNARRTQRVRRAVVAGGLAVALGTTGLSGVAAAESDESRAGNLLSCLGANGATAPGPEGITNAWIDQVIAAARRCGIELPEALIAEVRRRAAELEAKRACLTAAGVAKPADGQLPTREQLAAYAAAARSCGWGEPSGPPQSPGTEPAPREQAQPGGGDGSRPAARKRQRTGPRAASANRSTRRAGARR